MSTKQSSWSVIVRQLILAVLLVASLVIVAGFSADTSEFSSINYRNRFRDDSATGATANAVEHLARAYSPPRAVITNLLLVIVTFVLVQIIYELRRIGTRLDEVADAEPKPPAFAMPIYQVPPPQFAQMPAMPTWNPPAPSPPQTKPTANSDAPVTAPPAMFKRTRSS